MSTLTFQGAVGEVTGSRYLIEVDDDGGAHRLLLECGLHQGGADADEANARPFGALAGQLEAVVISHGHLDHAGLLPKLVREGYRGPIHCTRGTRDLLDIMLRDAAFVMAKDLEWENKWRKRNGKPAVEPLYELEDVERTLGALPGRRPTTGEAAHLFAALLFLCAYGPFFLLKRDPFNFYFLIAAPFFSLVLAGYLGKMWNARPVARLLVVLFMVGALAVFAFFHPVVAGTYITEQDFQYIMHRVPEMKQ